jgi:hypothetical protein
MSWIRNTARETVPVHLSIYLCVARLRLAAVNELGRSRWSEVVSYMTQGWKSQRIKIQRLKFLNAYP